MGRKVAGILLCAVGLIGCIGVLTTGSAENTVSGCVAGALFILIGLILLLKKGKTSEVKKAQNEAKEKAEHTVFCKHTTGLPLAPDTPCNLYFDSDVVSISGSGNEFRVAYNKITDISVKTDVEIQKSYVSSVGGAVGGALLFGPLGAIVGGRAKEKKSTTVEYYLIITYVKEDSVDYLSFLLFGPQPAKRLIAETQEKFIGKPISIDL